MIQKKIARSDALYSGVAMGVTILEIALLTTNKKLGEHAFEMALSLQIFISIIIDVTGVWFISKTGVVNTTIIGYIFKFLAVVFLFFGFWASVVDMNVIGWGVIIVSFVFDSLGTGCLKSSFRPAYNSLSVKLYNSESDYIMSIKYYLYLRIGIPLFLLVISSVLLNFISIAITSLLVLILMSLTRLIQLTITYLDLRILRISVTPEKPAVMLTILYFKKIKKYDLLFYIIGNTIETFILIYMIGMFYRYNHYINISESFNWLGSSLFSFAMYVFCSFIAAKFIPRMSGKEHSLLINVFIFIPLVIFLLLLIKTPDNIYDYFISIIVSSVCLVFSSLIVRVAATRILKSGNDIYAASSFIYGEFFSSIAIAICLFFSLQLQSDYYVKYSFVLIMLICTAWYLFLFIRWYNHDSGAKEVSH